MTRGVIDAARVASVPWAAGHFWMYAQYVDGLGRLGCDVWWLEELPAGAGSAADEAHVETLRAHDRYFSIGEHLDGSVPDVTWTHTAPAVSLDLWPYRYDPASEAFTSVSSRRTGAYVSTAPTAPCPTRTSG